MLCSIGQRYNLKAIHNQVNEASNLHRVVFNRSKIQSESNSQQREFNRQSKLDRKSVV